MIIIDYNNIIVEIQSDTEAEEYEDLNELKMFLFLLISIIFIILY